MTPDEPGRAGERDDYWRAVALVVASEHMLCIGGGCSCGHWSGHSSSHIATEVAERLARLSPEPQGLMSELLDLSEAWIQRPEREARKAALILRGVLDRHLAASLEPTS